jgi:hypothetical protein
VYHRCTARALAPEPIALARPSHTRDAYVLRLVGNFMGPLRCARLCTLLSRFTAKRLHALGIDPETCAMDQGYDVGSVYEACADREVLPVIPPRETIAVKRREDKPPRREHGEWRFAGADHKRDACKWRCPTAECKPASVWVKADRPHSLTRARRCAGRGTTVVARPSSARSDASRTNGRSHRFACAGSSA